MSSPEKGLTLENAFRRLKEDIIFIQNENMKLQEINNQLKQAISALNKEPTNSL